MIRTGLKKLATQKRKAFWKVGHSHAAAGYGLALLMVFLASTVLIGTSVQLMLGSNAGSYLGTSTQDNLSANAVAQTGMETVLADIQSDLDSGTPVTTSYSYSSTNINMPTDSATLGGGTSVIGSFSGQVTSILGNTYTVQVTATVNSVTLTLTKTLTMVRNSKPLDVMTNANAAYSVRKLRSIYTGSALRVRRASDNAEQDIGFDINGNLDMASLNTFLSTNTMPLDSVGSAAAAFGLRKLRNAYTGYALNVRRSSDSATQDIGFTTAGDLDVAALLSFVGSGSGYVTTWYDQSGNGNNATMSATWNQPLIVENGILCTLNNRPAMKYVGLYGTNSDILDFNRTISNDFTIMACFSVLYGDWDNTNLNWYDHAGIIDMEVAGLANDFGTSVDLSGNIYAGVGGGSSGSGDTSIVVTNPGYNDKRMHWMAFTRTKSTGLFSLYVDNASYSGITPNTASLTANSTIRIGGLNTGARQSLNGYINEVLVYGSVLSDTNRQLIQRNEGWYYNMAPAYQSLTPLADTLGTPKVAYGLRKLGSGVTGSAIKVRRSGDNATQDIGFDTLGNLDIASLLSFVGSANGYVTTWYDQSGNGKNVTQATAAQQPMIVSSGNLITVNGRPAIKFTSASSQILQTGTTTGLPSSSSSRTLNAVYAVNNASSSPVPMGWGTVTNYSLSALLHDANVGFWGYNADLKTTLPSDTSLHNVTASYTSGSNAAAIYRDGASLATGTVHSLSTPSSTNFSIGAAPNSSGYLDGYVSEVWVYGSALSNANLLTLQQNQGSYFSQPIPLAYVKKWYDQSGNGNDQVQYNTNMQPTLVMPPVGNVSTWPTVAFSGGQYLTSSNGMPTSSNYSKVAIFSMANSAMCNNIISGNLQTNGHALWMGMGNYLGMVHNDTYFPSFSTLFMAVDTNYAIAATFTQTSPTRTGTVYRGNVSGGSSTTPYTNTDPSILLGAYRGGGFQLSGTISEAAVFARALSATDRTTLYNDERGYFGAQ